MDALKFTSYEKGVFPDTLRHIHFIECAVDKSAINEFDVDKTRVVKNTRAEGAVVELFRVDILYLEGFLLDGGIVDKRGSGIHIAKLSISIFRGITSYNPLQLAIFAQNFSNAIRRSNNRWRNRWSGNLLQVAKSLPKPEIGSI